MVEETILQHWILAKFVFPFLLIFFIAFGILEKTKIFGDGKKQLNALISFIIGLIFVGAVFPKLVVGNLVLFLAVTMVTFFVGLVLWAFATRGEAKIENAGLKKFIAFLIMAGLVVVLLWSAGIQISIFENVYEFLFKSSWSKDFWINTLFIAMVILAIAFALTSGGSSSGKGKGGSGGGDP